jgi:hypothetical protein
LEGRLESFLLGISDGELDGSLLGTWEAMDGIKEGSTLGRSEGKELGRADVDG